MLLLWAFAAAPAIAREGVVATPIAVKGLKTDTGRPILANDPHRSLEVPSLRYIAHLVAPGLDVIGAGEPSLPGIAIGHNERIAFGITVFWHGYVDRELLPSEINPARGYIATANQMNLPRDYPYAERRVSFDWIDDEFRFRRISEVLDGLPKSSVKDSAELQNDTLSLPARRLMTVLGVLVVPDPQLQEVAHWLSAWDGKVAAESPQAALFEVWISRHLLTAVMARITPALSERVRASAKAKLSAAVVDLIEHPDRRLGSDPKKVRDELMLQTLNEALRETQQLVWKRPGFHP